MDQRLALGKGALAVNQEHRRGDADRDQKAQHHIQPHAAHLQAARLEHHPDEHGVAEQEDVDCDKSAGRVGERVGPELHVGAEEPEAEVREDVAPGADECDHGDHAIEDAQRFAAESHRTRSYLPPGIVQPMTKYVAAVVPMLVTLCSSFDAWKMIPPGPTLRVVPLWNVSSVPSLTISSSSCSC